jgi:hypothetical protein
MEIVYKSRVLTAHETFFFSTAKIDPLLLLKEKYRCLLFELFENLKYILWVIYGLLF